MPGVERSHRRHQHQRAPPGITTELRGAGWGANDFHWAPTITTAIPSLPPPNGRHFVVTKPIVFATYPRELSEIRAAAAPLAVSESTSSHSFQSRKHPYPAQTPRSTGSMRAGPLRFPLLLRAAGTVVAVIALTALALHVVAVIALTALALHPGHASGPPAYAVVVPAAAAQPATPAAVAALPPGARPLFVAPSPSGKRPGPPATPPGGFVSHSPHYTLTAEIHAGP